ncbi:MAG: HlyD family efflux transporter periplasmic adaptor subunit [Lachnospiraceae bacterium]|nr:HlyD family efflux transporter periplasmic adaptor subunit [Lachnospiraceae bacterium]
MSKVKKNNKKKGIIIVVVIVALVIVIRLVSYLFLKGASNIDIMSSGVQVQSFGKHDLSESVNASGIVESQNVISVTTDFTGKIKELNVSLGDYVNAGDVLCVFDDTELREQIKELEAQVSTSEKLTAKQNEIAQRNLQQAKDNQTKEVASASEAVSKAQTDYDNAVITYNSAASAFDELKSRKDVDSMVLEEAKAKTDAAYENMIMAQTALSEANRNLEGIKQSTAELVQSAQDSVDTNAISNTGNGEVSKELAKLYRQLDEVNVLAEQSGIITSLNVSQGSIPNGVLMQIEDNANLKIKVNIKEKDIIKLKSGMTATVKSDSFPDDRYPGTVSRVINFASSQGNIMDGQNPSSGGYSAEITIDNETGLLLGMTAKVEIAIKESKEVLSVPYDSIMSDEKGTFVYRAVKQKNGMHLIERIEITEGEKSDYYTAIQSDKLKEGDLIVNYPEEVTDGEEVTVYIPEEDNEITSSKESE